jgi:hypothetical protein
MTKNLPAIPELEQLRKWLAEVEAELAELRPKLAEQLRERNAELEAELAELRKSKPESILDLLGIKKPEPKPPVWAYDRLLLAEVRERAEVRKLEIGPLPRANELNDPWRRQLEQLIGHDVVMEKLFRRKPGKRGPGKQHQTGETGMGKDLLAQKRKKYSEKKGPAYIVR